MLKSTVDQIAEASGAVAVAVAYHDFETDAAWALRARRPFHAASMMKTAVLLALAEAVDAGRFGWDDRLHVRNRFVSAADGSIYRVGEERDANAEVHDTRGRTMRLRRLADHMIQTSSNLATNLLLDLVTVEAVRATVKRLDAKGVEIVRGVEDQAAYDAGINNTATAEGLVRLFSAVEDEEAFSEETRGVVRDILMGQAFRSGIPAGVPEEARRKARFAHKTGSISTVQHDAGLVYLPERRPYAVAILTEWEHGETEASGRREAVAKISEAVFEHLTEHAK